MVTPLDLAVETVSRRSRDVLYDRLAGADKTVEKGRFSNFEIR
jgi:hypothetical protein